MTDFRALCAELLAHAKKAQKIAAQDLWFGDEDDGLFDRADAALAEQPARPTDDQIDELWDKEAGYYELYEEVRNVVHTALARWGQS